LIGVISLQIIFSKSFGITDKMDILRFSPFLKIGTTKEIFKTAGKIPVDKHRLNRSVSGTLATETNFLSMDCEMPSGPEPLCSSSLKMAFSTAVCVSWTRDTLCDSCFSSEKVSSVGNEMASPSLT
jgi:hypothetical protein